MKKVIIYADGASRGNGAKDAIGAYGAIITCGGKKKEISKAFKGVTNNQMELSGVIEALKLLKSPCQVQLYSDSKYVCDAFNKNWIEGWKKKGWKTASKKPVANKELWEELINLINIHQVTFNWVKGHADNKGNQRADELCNLAMDNYNEETNKCEWDETGDIIQDVADRKCMNDISHLKNIKTKTFTLRYDFMKSVEDILENTKRDDLDKVKEELIDTIDFMFRLEE